jgi:DNA-nicking Smr family endonuclease
MKASDWIVGPPAAEFDLHGQSVLEAVANAERFLQSQCRARPGAVVRLITGRGSSGGGAPIRTRVRTLLRRLKEEGRLVRGYELEDGEGSFLVRLTG